jgi:hypothetical protein
MEKINNIKIRVLNNKNNNKFSIHENLIKDQSYPFFYISAKKNSGKTTILYNLILNMATKKTNIYIFSKTYENDNTCVEMINKLSKYCNIQCYDNLDYENQEGEKYKNILEKLIDDIKIDIAENKDKIKKLKYTYTRHLFIFDDFSELLKDKILEGVIKRHRHYLISCIISTQQFTDIPPPVRSQINVLILFKEISNNRLKMIYDEKIKNIDYDTFIDLYNKATEQKYNFIFINCDDNKDIRQNFDNKFII